jgi:septin family protein
VERLKSQRFEAVEDQMQATSCKAQNPKRIHISVFYLSPYDRRLEACDLKLIAEN